MIARVGDNRVRFSLQHTETGEQKSVVTVAPTVRLPITDGAVITVLPLARLSQGVAFGIETPDGVSVLRSELLEQPRMDV